MGIKSRRSGIMVLPVIFSLSAVFLLWHGCGGGGGGGGGSSGSTQIASATIGSNGGDLSAPDNIVTMSVPQGALTSSLNFTMSEVSTAPPASAGTLISKRYDFGPSGTKFSSLVEITFTYDAAKVSSTNEQSLKVFYDDGGGWIGIPSTVDTTNNKVSCQVLHLTRFALLAPADTTPPGPPTDIKVSVVNGSVQINWTNPSLDYHHTRIYRSTNAPNPLPGDWPALIFENVPGEEKLDTTVNPGVTYWYTVVSVDGSGNESAVFCDPITVSEGLTTYDLRDYFPLRIGDYFILQDGLRAETVRTELLDGVPMTVERKSRSDGSFTEALHAFDPADGKYKQYGNYEGVPLVLYKLDPPILIGTSSMQVGETFTTTYSFINTSTGLISSQSFTVSLTFAGLETVTTPAGTFLNCLKYTGQNASGPLTVWFAKGIGMVKEITRDGKENPAVYIFSNGVSYGTPP